MGPKSRHHLQTQDWELRTLRRLRAQYPGRHIRFRPKPGRPFRRQERQREVDVFAEALVLQAAAAVEHPDLGRKTASASRLTSGDMIGGRRGIFGMQQTQPRVVRVGQLRLGITEHPLPGGRVVEGPSCPRSSHARSGPLQGGRHRGGRA